MPESEFDHDASCAQALVLWWKLAEIWRLAPTTCSRATADSVDLLGFAGFCWILLHAHQHLPFLTDRVTAAESAPSFHVENLCVLLVFLPPSVPPPTATPPFLTTHHFMQEHLRLVMDRRDVPYKRANAKIDPTLGPPLNAHHLIHTSQGENQEGHHSGKRAQKSTFASLVITCLMMHSEKKLGRAR